MQRSEAGCEMVFEKAECKGVAICFLFNLFIRMVIYLGRFKKDWIIAVVWAVGKSKLPIDETAQKLAKVKMKWRPGILLSSPI